MFNAIRQTCQAYYDEIPANTWLTIGKSAIYSFTVTLLIGKNLNSTVEMYSRPFVSAGLAALAASVHALMTPLFNRIFGNAYQLNVLKEFVKCVVEIGLIRLSFSYATANKIDLLTKQRFSFISMNFFKSLFHIPVDTVAFFAPHDAENEEVRRFYAFWGLSTPNGANTTFVVF